jgi:hypothetical protein
VVHFHWFTFNPAAMPKWSLGIDADELGRLLKNSFRRSSIPFRTPLDSVVFTVSTSRSRLFQLSIYVADLTNSSCAILPDEPGCATVLVKRGMRFASSAGASK